MANSESRYAKYRIMNTIQILNSGYDSNHTNIVVCNGKEKGTPAFLALCPASARRGFEPPDES
jgi:hypothetical protein